ncbi:hypothetical protein Tco_1482884 [Tanacetum coccineum]
MIKLYLFLVMEVWFKELLPSNGFIMSKGLIIIYSPLVNSVMRDLKCLFGKCTCYNPVFEGNDLLDKVLRGPDFELLKGTSPVVSMSFAVHAADNPDKRQQHNTTHTSTTTDVADPLPFNIHSTHQIPSQVPTVTALENINQAETNTENA